MHLRVHCWKSSNSVDLNQNKANDFQCNWSLLKKKWAHWAQHQQIFKTLQKVFREGQRSLAQGVVCWKSSNSVAKLGLSKWLLMQLIFTKEEVSSFSSTSTDIKTLQKVFREGQRSLVQGARPHHAWVWPPDTLPTQAPKQTRFVSPCLVVVLHPLMHFVMPALFDCCIIVLHLVIMSS